MTGLLNIEILIKVNMRVNMQYANIISRTFDCLATGIGMSNTKAMRLVV